MRITDVAKEAGVSVATVSRVLNNNGYPIRPETRDRVLAAVKRLGFRPNDLARGLLLKKTRTVGLIIPDITNPYYPALTRGVEDVASAELYTIVFCNTDRRADKAELYVNGLLEKRVDGIIIAGGGTDFAQASQTFADFGARVVFIGRHRCGSPSVQIDNVGLSRAATLHLVELGHRDIGIIAGPLALPSFEDRLTGYRQALEEHDIGWDGRLMREVDADEAGGYAATRSLLDGQPRPTALVAANDRVAIGALAAANDLGVRIPEELSIIGADDIAMASYVRPALTTMRLPMYEIGASAMRLMLRLLELGRASEPEPADESRSGQEGVIRLPTELVVRGSSGPPAHAEAGTERASRGLRQSRQAAS
jgi:LacI family transcriptional regulator